MSGAEDDQRQGDGALHEDGVRRLVALNLPEVQFAKQRQVAAKRIGIAAPVKIVAFSVVMAGAADDERDDDADARPTT